MVTGLRQLGAGGSHTPPLILGGNVFGWTADEAISHAVLTPAQIASLDEASA